MFGHVLTNDRAWNAVLPAFIDKKAAADTLCRQRGHACDLR